MHHCSSLCLKQTTESSYHWPLGTRNLYSNIFNSIESAPKCSEGDDDEWMFDIWKDPLFEKRSRQRNDFALFHFYLNVVVVVVVVVVVYSTLLNMCHSRPLFLNYFRLFNKVESRQCSISILPMIGFELHTSGARSDWATTTNSSILLSHMQLFSWRWLRIVSAQVVSWCVYNTKKVLHLMPGTIP